jgi:predicted ATPase/DNA-binding XRE family transcriptional regulator
MLLQRYRAAAGLSQEGLAERAALSRRGISDLERGERRSPHAETVRRLADALSLSLTDRSALLAGAHAATTVATSQVPQRLPLPVPLTSFVGRTREVADVRRLLRVNRLLTLTGPGGIGKTRLALEAIQTIGDAAFVDLAPHSDGGLVPAAVAAALGVREQSRASLLDLLVADLLARPVVVVLDNCEHLVTACSELADQLLRACPELHIVATSRQPLAVAGEQLWPVPPLPFGESTDSETAVTSDAVRLFEERARLVQPAFSLGDGRTAIASEVCRHLDGIPLAIELAAARVRLLGLEGVADRLGERLRLFSADTRGVPARQRTLRAAIDWSYDLLSEPERDFFRRLSLFASGWTATAAGTICGLTDEMPSDVTLDLLARLVDRSLVQVESVSDVGVRYGFLETIREYALDQLQACGEEAALRQRHAAYFLALAEDAEPELWGARREVSLKRLEPDLDNARGALQWLIDSGDGQTALKLGAALGRFWLVMGLNREGQVWTTRLLGLACAEDPTLVRAKLLRANASLWAFQGEAAAAQPMAEAALELMRRHGPEIDVARTLIVLGDTVQTRGDLAAARCILQEAVTVSRRAGATVELVDALHYLGGDALAVGDLERARSQGHECLALARQIGYSLGVARAQWVVGSISYIEHDGEAARHQLEASIAASRELGAWWEAAQASGWLGHVEADAGGHARSASLFAQLLQLGRQLGDRELLCIFLEGAAHLAAAAAQPERALRLAGAATRQRETIDSVPFPVLERLLHQWLAPARAALGEAATASVLAAGRALSLEEALAETSEADYARQ